MKKEVNKKLQKRIWSLLLCTTLVFGSVDVTVFASETAEEETETQMQTETGAETEHGPQDETKTEQRSVGDDSEQEIKTENETQKEMQTEGSKASGVLQSSEMQTEEQELVSETNEEPGSTEFSEKETEAEELFALSTSGSCGQYLTWNFDEGTGVLTITGSGAMNISPYGTPVMPWMYVKNDITKIVFENDSNGKGLTSIDEGAFSGCSGLTGELKFPSDLGTIGQDAFSGCSGLTKLELPSSLTSISFSAFEGCSGLRGKLELPSNLKYIYSSAFDGCRGLEGTLELPPNLTNIGSSAFSGCSGLTGLKLSSNLTYIGDSAFRGCSGLTGKLEFSSSLTDIGDFAFRGCSGLTELKFSSGLTCIDNSAFSGCSGLTGKLELPSSLTRIGDSAFYGCSDLTELKLPQGLKYIGNSAFSKCSGLTGYIYIPKTVQEIRTSAFSGCTNMKRDVYIQSTDIEFSASASNWQHFRLTESSDGTNVVTIHAPKGSTAETFANSYDYYAFEEWDGVTLPDDFNGDVSSEYFTINEQVPNDEFWIMLVKGNGEKLTGKEIEETATDLTVKEVKTLLPDPKIEYKIDADSNIVKVKVNPYSGKRIIKKLSVHVNRRGQDGYTDSINKEKIFTCTGGGSAYMVVNDVMSEVVIDYVMVNDGEGEDIDLTRKLGNFYRSDNKTYPLDIAVSNATPTKYQLVMLDDRNNEILLQEYDNPENVSYDFGTIKEDDPLLFLKAFNGELELCKAILRVTLKNNKPNLLSGGTLGFGSDSKISITVPDEIPIMGGNELEFDLKKEIPVSVDIGLNNDGEQVLKISGMLGLKEWGIEEDDENQDNNKKLNFSNFKEKLKSTYKNMKNPDFTKTKVAGFSAELNAGVYLEGRYNGNEKIVKMNMVYLIEITGESGVTYSTLIGPVPVYVGITGSITGKAEMLDPVQFTVIFDGEESGIKFTNELGIDGEVEVGIAPKLGVGLNKLLSAEIEGEGKLTWGIKIKGAVRQTVDLTFGVGINVTAFIFTYSRTLAETTFRLLPNSNSHSQMSMSSLMSSIYDEDSYTVMQRDYILEGDGSAGVTAYAAENSPSANVLINGMYPDAQPRFVSYNGTDYLFYLEDQTSRAVEDKSTLVYRVNTGNGWSSAKVVNDDNTADFSYDVAVGSDGLYIAWMNAEDSLADVTEMSQMMEHITLSMAKLSGDGQVTMLDTPKTEEEMTPMAVSLASDGSSVWVYWYANTEKDILNNSNGRNIVYTAKAGSGTAQKLAEIDDGIMTFAGGLLGGLPYVAATVDTDGKVDTIEDREICLIDGTGVRLITGNEVLDSNPQFGTIDGEQVLLYYSEGDFMCYDGTNITPLFGSKDAGVESDDFELVCDGSNAVIIWQGSYVNAEKMGHSIVMSAYRNGKWTKPSNVAQTDGSLIDFTAKVKEGSGAQLYYTTRGDVNGQDIIRLYEAEAKEIGKAVFRGVLCDTESYKPGSALPIDVTLENTGTCGISECGIFIENSKGARVYAMENISAPVAGATRDLTISDFRPVDTGNLENYTVKLVCDGNVCDSETLEIGGAEFTLGYRTEYRDGQSDEELLFVAISNDSNFAGDVKLTISGGESGTVLYENISENLLPDYSASSMCSLTELWEKTSDSYITIKAESLGRKEPYLLDNTINIYNYDCLKKEVNVLIQQQDVKLRVGDTLQLETRIYTEGDTDTSLAWESSESAYATVDGNGLVTAVSQGIAVITVRTVDGNTASCTVTVVGEDDPLTPEGMHTITYYDGTQQIAMEPSAFREDEAVLLLASYKAGYDFAGWYEMPDFSGSAIEWIPKGTTTDKVLYAKWAERVRQKDTAKTETSLSVEFAGTGIYTYTGAAIKPEVIVRDEGQVLQQGIDYTVSYKNNTQAATAVSGMAQQGIAPYVDSAKAPMALITGKGNYKGKKAAAMNFTISAKELSDASIVLACDDSMASKAAKGGYADQQLGATLKDGKKSLNKAKDYIITYDYLGEDGSRTPTGADKDMAAVNKPGVYTVHISARIAKDSDGRMIRSAAKNNVSNANYTGSMEPFNLYVQDSSKILGKAKITLASTKGIQQGTAGITVGQVIKSITFGSGKTAETYGTDTAEKLADFKQKFDVTGLDTLTARAGTGYVTVRAKDGSGYYGSRRVAVKILGTPLSKAVFTQNGGSTAFIYNGTAQMPAYTLQAPGTDATTLTEGKDYTITYQKGRTAVPSPVEAGNYTAIYTGTGGYTGTVKKTFKIAPLDLAAAYKADKNSITVTASAAPYNPKGAVPAEVTVAYRTADGTAVTLTAEDYSIACSANKAIGKGSLSLNAKGNYKGTIKNITTYDIVAKSMASEDITVEVDDVFYKAGADITPKLAVYDNGVKVNAKDYTVAFDDGSTKLAGYHLPDGAEYADIGLTVTANAGKNYTEGTKASAKLHIYTKKISSATAVLAPNGTDNQYYYTGRQVRPALQSVTYKDSKNAQGITLANSETEGYLVSYGANTNTGLASVTIYGTGKYGGSKTIKFTIYPKWMKWIFG